MKLSQLKTIVKQAVKEAIQEEMKDILLEAVRSPKHTIYESKTEVPTPSTQPSINYSQINSSPKPEISKTQMRENIHNVLGGMMSGKDGVMSVNTNTMPLQLNGNMDTASPNGSLPAGDVSMDQIMGLMNK